MSIYNNVVYKCYSLFLGSSTDLLPSDKALAASANNGDTTARTGPPQTEGDASTNGTAQTENKELDTLGHENKLFTQSGVVVGNSVPGGVEEDWVNLSLSPNHPLQSDKHPLQNSGGE